MKNKKVAILLGVVITASVLVEAGLLYAVINRTCINNNIGIDMSEADLYGPYMIQEDTEEDDFYPSSEDSYTMYGMARPNNTQN